MLSTLSGGWPTEAGMDPETEPHMPAERARSRPTMEISFNTCGPVPIRVADLRGRVILPPSMR